MPTSHPRRWLILFVVLAAECMDLLDGTVVNVAAPTIHHDLHTSSTALQWIVGGYALALAVGLLTGARLGDLFGRRRLFVIGAAGFTVASTVCGLAATTGILIGARLVQGLFGALMLPQGLGVLREVFAPEDQAKAFGLFGPVMGSAALLGPIIGGGLIDLNLLGSGWRLVFLVNLPLGMLAVIGAVRLLPLARASHAAGLDLVGAALASLAAVMLVYPLIQGRALGWPAWTFAMMGASILLLVVFAVHLRGHVHAGRDPLVEPSVFAHRGYSGVVVVLMLYFAGMIGSVLALTLFIQLGEHFSAIHAGLTLIPFALGTAIGAPLSGGLLAPRFGRLVIQAGGVVSLLGYALMIAALAGNAAVSSWQLAGPLLVVGLGMGLFIAPIFDMIIAAVSDRETGSASGIINALQQLAGAVGVATLGSVFFTAAARGDFHGALRTTLWWQLALLGLMLVVSPLLPRRARETATALTAPVTATEGDLLGT